MSIRQLHTKHTNIATVADRFLYQTSMRDLETNWAEMESSSTVDAAIGELSPLVDPGLHKGGAY